MRHARHVLAVRLERVYADGSRRARHSVSRRQDRPGDGDAIDQGEERCGRRGPVARGISLEQQQQQRGYCGHEEEEPRARSEETFLKTPLPCPACPIARITLTTFTTPHLCTRTPEMIHTLL